MPSSSPVQVLRVRKRSVIRKGPIVVAGDPDQRAAVEVEHVDPGHHVGVVGVAGSVVAVRHQNHALVGDAEPYPTQSPVFGSKLVVPPA